MCHLIPFAHAVSPSTSSKVTQDENFGGFGSAAPTAKIASQPSSRSSSFCGPMNVQQVVGFSLQEMKEATRNFAAANLLGRGSYGMVSE